MDYGNTSTHLYPWRQNVAAQVAEELKMVTYATPPMEGCRKNKQKKPTLLSGKFGPPYLGAGFQCVPQVSLIHAFIQNSRLTPARAALPSPTSACWVFSCFRIIIHRTLTWTTVSLTCVCDHSYAGFIQVFHFKIQRLFTNFSKTKNWFSKTCIADFFQ